MPRPSSQGKRAGEENRTPDLLITSEPLCRLSYPGHNGVPLEHTLHHILADERSSLRSFDELATADDCVLSVERRLVPGNSQQRPFECQ